MAEVAILLYVVVEDDEGKREKGKESFRYTRPVLQSTLQIMGCKARHAFKMSKRVFELIRGELINDDALLPVSAEKSGLDGSHEHHLEKENESCNIELIHKVEVENCVSRGKDSKTYELYKKRTTVVVKRDVFLDVVCDVLTEYKYVGLNQREDLMLACSVREKKESVTVLLCGTSGCGKSTLSSLLASRLGITTVISTDSIRHMMRGFVDEKENPLVWASTYHAGECLDPVAVAKAKNKRKAKKLTGKLEAQSSNAMSNADMISAKQMAIEGYKAQSEMVIESLDRLITSWEQRNESVVVEGVHLSLNFVMGLMKKHPSIIPFMIFISNEEKHMERFAVRAKYMTVDPSKNKYIKYIRNIRSIQEYLCHRADKHLVPKINNTNVDKSVAAIHATVFGCLRRRGTGEQVFDPVTNTVSLVHEEYRNQCAADSLSSKCMFQLIQSKGSSRHLMAIRNNDGSVARAWPVSSLDSKGKSVLSLGIENGIVGYPMYGPLQISKAEAVNLQFGHFGISAWPSDICGTSYAGSVDESRDDGVEAGSSCRYYSSCGSTDGAAKEPMDENSVYGSDEEMDDPPYGDSDDSNKQAYEEEMEGSVDEESTKSDEEYDDLAMEDVQDNGYWYKKLVSVPEGHGGRDTREDIYRRNLDRFLKTRIPIDKGMVELGKGL